MYTFTNVMASRGCVNSPDRFCYICGELLVKRQERKLTNFVEKVYLAYFGVRVGDQDKAWAPHRVCSSCVEGLRMWSKGKVKCFRFGVPMIWREPKNHSDDCYFCSCNIQGYSLKNKDKICYPNLESALRPVSHGPGIPIPLPPESLSDVSGPSGSESDDNSDDDFPHDCSEPQLFSQSQLNDLIRDLALSKDSAQLLGSRLQEKNLLTPGTSFSWFRNREKDYVPYFSQDGELVYCSDITGLMQLFRVQHEAHDWRLFIDSSQRSLKAVLLHNGNKYASIPVGHSVHLKEKYDNLAFILTKLNYKKYEWTICGDLKVISMILGQQGGYTKYPCFLCEWDSRAKAKHWTDKVWPSRTLKVGEKNVHFESLVDPKKVLLPPLHIKLGIMKQFVKALPKDGDTFKYLASKFPRLSEAKLKEGVFVGPDIRKLMRDDIFDTKMKEIERSAWQSFKEVVKKFLGNYRDTDFENIVGNMMKNLKALGCSMSLKLHFLNSHLNYFPENLGAVSEEQGERFHQDIKEMERRYQGQWNVNMIADYCWMLHREEPQAVHKRKSSKRSFEGKKKRYYKDF